MRRPRISRPVPHSPTLRSEATCLFHRLIAAELQVVTSSHNALSSQTVTLPRGPTRSPHARPPTSWHAAKVTILRAYSDPRTHPWPFRGRIDPRYWAAFWLVYMYVFERVENSATVWLVGPSFIHKLENIEGSYLQTCIRLYGRLFQVTESPLCCRSRNCKVCLCRISITYGSSPFICSLHVHILANEKMRKTFCLHVRFWSTEITAKAWEKK